jgi:hypothetical protein
MFTERPKLLFCLLLFLSAPYSVSSQNNQPDTRYKLLPGKSYVQSKNYYLLTLFEELPGVKKLLASDTALVTMGRNKLQSLTAALKTGAREALCYTNVLKFSPQEIQTVSDRLKVLYRPDNALGQLVKGHLVPSGTYILLRELPAAELLAKAWTQDAEGINYAIDVYAEGKKPNYPPIDSISFDIRSNEYVGLLYNTASLVAAENASNHNFYNLPLQAALQFIEMNEREQAADYEPMTEGENKAAYTRIKSIKWDAYKYSLILVPGAGPEDPAVPLSAEGMIRCRLAALQYQNGIAPFIVVSGGKVHPYKTKYCEAIEMKKYLTGKLHIPEHAIIIEPHARHTTTNMRNTARLMYRYGIPFTKVALTCTTRFQSSAIEKTLIARCMKELNEAPFKTGERLSETEMEFYPSTEALQINPKEPLDP